MIKITLNDKSLDLTKDQAFALLKMTTETDIPILEDGDEIRIVDKKIFLIDRDGAQVYDCDCD